MPLELAVFHSANCETCELQCALRNAYCIWSHGVHAGSDVGLRGAVHRLRSLYLLDSLETCDLPVPVIQSNAKAGTEA